MSERLVSVLVIEHPPSVSEEVAVAQRNAVDRAAETMGLKCVAGATDYGDAAEIGMRLVMGDPE